MAENTYTLSVAEKTVFKKQSATRKDRKGIVIQVVEDDPFTQKLVANVLSDFEVISSGTVADALKGYTEHAPDIIFLDINLPDGSGHDILQQIVSIDPKAYAIMLSGNRSMADVSKALQSGAKGFVAKPFPKDKLLNCIKTFQQGT